MLRAKSPEAVEKRLKVLFYGGAGSGKTTCSISFPSPYLIDTEKGASNTQYINKLKEVGGVIFQTTDFDEVVEEVRSLLSMKHEYRTLVIDSLTPIYNDLLDKSEKEVGSEFGRHYQHSNKKMKHLLNLLMRLDMNVIITCHAKNEYGQNLAVLGITYDGYKKLDYLFDAVFEVQKRGKLRVAMIRKSRIESLPDGEVIPFSYEEVAKRYGLDIIEREAVPETLATPLQIAMLDSMIKLYKEPPETVQKWLDKANANSFEEVNSAIMEKLINHMKRKANEI